MLKTKARDVLSIFLLETSCWPGILSKVRKGKPIGSGDIQLYTLVQAEVLNSVKEPMQKFITTNKGTTAISEEYKKWETQRSEIARIPLGEFTATSKQCYMLVHNSYANCHRIRRLQKSKKYNWAVAARWQKRISLIALKKWPTTSKLAPSKFAVPGLLESAIIAYPTKNYSHV